MTSSSTSVGRYLRAALSARGGGFVCCGAAARDESAVDESAASQTSIVTSSDGAAVRGRLIPATSLGVVVAVLVVSSAIGGPSPGCLRLVLTPKRPCSMAAFMSSSTLRPSATCPHRRPLSRILSAFSSPLCLYPNAAHSDQNMACACQNPSDLRYLNVSLASSMLLTSCCRARPR